jgi:hypothetical protein
MTHSVLNDLVLDFPEMVPGEIVMLWVKAYIGIDIVVQFWHI